MNPPEIEQSGGSEYLSAKEQTEDHLQPKALYRSDSESEELDPLACSTIILEGQWEPELIDVKLHSDPELNFESEPRPEPRIGLVQPIIEENRVKGTKLNLPKVFNKTETSSKILHTAKIYMGINDKNWDSFVSHCMYSSHKKEVCIYQSRTS